MATFPPSPRVERSPADITSGTASIPYKPSKRRDGTCGTCRYWDQQPSWQREQRGPCQRVMPGHAPDDMPFIQAATAHTRLTTPHDFGCSLWEGDEGE